MTLDESAISGEADTPADTVQLRAVRGAGYTIVASAITAVVGFTRSVMLARLLAPEDFGAVTFALFFANLFGTLTPFGFRQAFIHSDVIDESKGAATMLVVDVLMAAGRFIVILLLWPVFPILFPDYPLLASILTVFFAAYIIGAANGTPLAVLEKRLVYRRIALLNIVVSITITLITVLMAWGGFGIWSLVAEVALTRIVMFLGLFFVRPPWHFRWEPDWGFLRRFSKFTATVSATQLLGFLIDRFDDFWIGAALGKIPLGYYSRAYEYAGYPRRVFSEPVVAITFPAFARLKGDRLELSQVFTRGLSILIRLGFWVAVTLILTAPQFIKFFIGDKWLPMVGTFRLMAIYVLIDPLIAMVAMMFVAVGEPSIATQARLAQTAVFVPTVIVLGRRLGIDGVAIAADLMVMSGLVFVLFQARKWVSFSLRRLFLVPLVAILVSGSVVWLLGNAILLESSFIVQLVLKGALTSLCYFGILGIFEHRTYAKYLPFLWELYRYPRSGFFPWRRLP